MRIKKYCYSSHWWEDGCSLAESNIFLEENAWEDLDIDEVCQQLSCDRKYNGINKEIWRKK